LFGLRIEGQNPGLPRARACGLRCKNKRQHVPYRDKLPSFLVRLLVLARLLPERRDEDGDLVGEGLEGLLRRFRCGH